MHTSLENVSKDHRLRYQKASEYIKSENNVLDIACGIGYGSYMMSVDHSSSKFTGVDISEKTITFANKFYKRKNINYINDNCLTVPLEDKSFDVIVSFETVEHIDEDSALLERLHKALKDDGTLITSVPNQDYMPFSKDTHPYHVRHYTYEEISQIISDAGFEVTEVFSQKNAKNPELYPGKEGIFNIIVAKKK